jgi:hypothetical protein
MAQVYKLEVQAGLDLATEFQSVAPSILFAESVTCSQVANEGFNAAVNAIIVTTNVSNSHADDGTYELLADDSMSERTIDVSTGKFVKGNMIASFCTLAEAKADLRDYTAYFSTSGDLHLVIGICNSTQSQDYTPGIIANSRNIYMLTPEQVESLGL